MNSDPQQAEWYKQLVVKRGADFLEKNEEKIAQLIEIMGDDGISWMNDLVGDSCDYFELIKVLSTENVAQLRKSYAATKEEGFVACIVIFGFLVDAEVSASNLDYTESLLPQLTSHLISFIYGNETWKETMRVDEILADTGIEELLQHAIFKKCTRGNKKLSEFAEKCERINANANQNYQYDVADFLIENEKKISQLIEIMGDDGIKWMSDQVAWSLVALERKLDSVKALSAESVAQLKESYKTNKGKGFVKCIIIFSFLEASEISVSGLNDKEPLLPQLGEKLLSLLLREEMLAEIQDFNEIIERVGIEQILHLMIARNKVRGKAYEDVYLKLLKYYLLGSNAVVDRFLHDTEQDDELGKKLASHNKRIRDELDKRGIDAKNALNYQKRERITIQADGAIELTAKQDSQNDDEQKLMNLIRQCVVPENKDGVNVDKKRQGQLRNLTKTLETLKQQLPKKPSAKELYSENTVNLLAKLANRSNALGLSGQFAEIIDLAAKLNIIANERMKNGAARYKALPKTACEKKVSVTEQTENSGEKYNFIIKQWSKTEIETLFLGDNVGCCLATDGEKSSDMVQRIMDDAILFHVAIDEKTNKPAALLWLFLAETDDGGTVLVANFCEVNVRYAKNASMRKSLLNSLLFYTYQYVQDNPGISQFYLRQLTYGNNKGDISGLPLKTVRLKDKLGGAFNQEDPNIYQCTLGNYYLAALEENNRLHSFNQKALYLKDRRFCEQINRYCNEDPELITRMQRILGIGMELQNYIREHFDHNCEQDDDLLKRAGIICRVCDSGLPFDINERLCLEFLKTKGTPCVNSLDDKITSPIDIALLFFWLKEVKGDYEVVRSKIETITSISPLKELTDFIEDADFNELCRSFFADKLVNIMESFDDLKFLLSLARNCEEQIWMIKAIPVEKLLTIIDSFQTLKKLTEISESQEVRNAIRTKLDDRRFIINFMEKMPSSYVSYYDLTFILELTSDYEARNEIIWKYESSKLVRELTFAPQSYEPRFATIFKMLNEEGQKYLISLFTAEQLVKTFYGQDRLKEAVGEEFFKSLEDNLSQNDEMAVAFTIWACKKGIADLIKVLNKFDENKRFDLLEKNQDAIRQEFSERFYFNDDSSSEIGDLLGLISSEQTEEFITKMLGVDWIRGQMLGEGIGASRVMYKLMFYSESVYYKIMNDSTLEGLKGKSENGALFWTQMFQLSQDKTLVYDLVNKLGDEYIKGLKYDQYGLSGFIEQLPKHERAGFIEYKLGHEWLKGREIEPQVIKSYAPRFFASELGMPDGPNGVESLQSTTVSFLNQS